MRPLDKVIDAALKLVPVDYAGKADLTKQLKSIKESYLYAAPEMHGHLWYKFGFTLQTALGDPDVAWKEDVVSLIQGTKDYQEVLGG